MHYMIHAYTKDNFLVGYSKQYKTRKDVLETIKEYRKLNPSMTFEYDVDPITKEMVNNLAQLNLKILSGNFIQSDITRRTNIQKYLIDCGYYD